MRVTFLISYNLVKLVKHGVMNTNKIYDANIYFSYVKDDYYSYVK